MGVDTSMHTIQRIELKEWMRKMRHLSSYHVTIDSFFVFSPDDSKKKVTVWATYISVTQKFY